MFPHFHNTFFSEDVALPSGSQGQVDDVLINDFFKGNVTLDSRPPHGYDAEKNIMEKLTRNNNHQTTRTTVVHCKKEKFDVYIGRPGKWGNPFTLQDYSRDQALLKYREWIVKQWDLLADLKELKGKTLGCWCKPNACHGDVLIELIERLKL